MRFAAAALCLLTACSSPSADGIADEGAGELRSDRDTGDPAVLADASDASADGDAGNTPRYEEVAPLINATCRPCHWGAFDSEQKVRQSRDAMTVAIVTGRMPQGYPEWKDLPEGQKVLDYLLRSR